MEPALGLGLLALLLAAWAWKYRRREPAPAPLEAAFLQRLEQQVPLSRGLPPAQRARWLGLVARFLARVRILGCRDLEIDDDLRAAVAGHACLLLIGRADLDLYPDLTDVLVYPSTYVRRDEWALDGSIVLQEENVPYDGESWDRGCVVLSAKAVREGAREFDGFHVVLHEFAHQFDALDGTSNGCPPMPRPLARRWAPAMQAAWQELIEADRKGQETFLDPYGAESPAEFFAVLTETFLELPWDLELEHPQLHTLMCELFGFDPKAWQERPADLPLPV